MYSEDYIILPEEDSSLPEVTPMACWFCGGCSGCQGCTGCKGSARIS